MLMEQRSVVVRRICGGAAGSAPGRPREHLDSHIRPIGFGEVVGWAMDGGVVATVTVDDVAAIVPTERR